MMEGVYLKLSCFILGKYRNMFKRFGTFFRIAGATVLTLMVAGSLWFAAPAPIVKALDFTFSPSISGNTGGSVTFTLKVDVTNKDLLPIKSIDLTIGDDAYFPTTYVANFSDLPTPATPNYTTPTETIASNGNTGGTISVRATTGAWWGDAYSASRKGYGYAYSNSSSSWLPSGYHALGGYSRGYGYGYKSYVGPTSITYNITWTPPSNWPANTYYIGAKVWGNSNIMIVASTSLTLSSPSIYEEEEPGVTDISDSIDEDGVFTETVTVESEDEQVTITIDAGITGLTAGGEPLTEISIVPMAEEDVPDPPAEGHIIGLTYDFGPDGATFDEPISVTISYNPDDIPEGTTPVIAMWDADLDPPQWVNLPCVVDTVNHTITASVDHFTAFAVITLPVVEEEEEVVPPVVTPPVVTPPVVEEEEEEEVTPPVVTPPVAEAGLAWWIWLIIGVAVVVVGLLVYFLWWRQRVY